MLPAASFCNGAQANVRKHSRKRGNRSYLKNNSTPPRLLSIVTTSDAAVELTVSKLPEKV